ncbi:hypothetical protein N665_0212s0014 [Sinapis alba]|nr:hypothetical protein N665_0212s0014 [Sinapis alba]
MDIKLNFRPSFFFFSFLIFIFLLQKPDLGSAASSPKCISSERQALVNFKQSLTDPSGRLSSWSGPDCCKWRGVRCDRRTSHVIKIDLRNPNQTLKTYEDYNEFKKGSLGGKINPSLTRLKFLSYLDLSSNDYNFKEIPEFIGRIVSLRYLNLSFSSFSGEVPASLGNLSKLESLDLYGQTFSDGPITNYLRASNLRWLLGLSSSLTYLNMGFVSMTDAGETWLEDFSRLSKLKELHLFNCELKNLPLSLPSYANLKHLEVLDLSRDYIGSPIPNWIFDLTSLRKLYLQEVDLQGSISSGFKNLKLLETLDLSNNLGLSGEIPAVLGDLPQLKYLDLSVTYLQGQIHSFLDAFSRNKGNSLVYLDLNYNHLDGTLPESLGALRKLQILDLSDNSFTSLIPSSVGNMTSMKKLDLSSNAMNGTIAESLGKLDRLETLDLSRNSMDFKLKLRPSFFFSFLIFIFLFKRPDLGSASSPKCISTERQALLTFKQSLTDPSARLSSWSGPDCCKWRGVRCDRRTSHVTKIDLRNPNQLVYFDESKRSCLGGKIHLSLTRLKFLRYLDLSSNDFNGLEIPEFIGSIVSLRYLNLSLASFSGEVPESLGNLSKLESLDLYAGSWPSFDLRANSLRWLSGLSSSLTYLNMGYVSLSGAGETWLEDFSTLSKLKELHLYSCGLSKLPLSLSSSANLKLLEVLDLSENSFSSPIPNWLFDLTSLRKLFLQRGDLEGSIPSGFKKLKLLETLDLSNNRLTGEIPAALGYLPLLKYLDLSINDQQGQTHRSLDALSKNKGNRLVYLNLRFNKLNGTLPESLGALRNLQILDLSSNSFTGSLPASLEELVDLNLMENKWEGVLLKSHFVNLKSLKNIRLNTEPDRSLVFKLPSAWVPPFRLEQINIENCQIGPLFPMWLQVQNKINSVTLRNTGIADKIPHSWFSGIASHVTELILENNRIKGTLPQKLVFPKLNTIDLSSNKFEGPFPRWTTTATQLYLHQNNFSGSLPLNIDALMPSVEKMYLFDNSFTGEIPSSLCEITGLHILNLRNNRFSGSFPNCWQSSSQLSGIDASENNISGEIPESLCEIPSLNVLLLNQNVLEGNIPDTFQNCSSLTHIDLGGNKLTGKLPSWLSKVLPLSMLRLQSNSFDGQIPDDLCNIQSLHILDLSENKLSGQIPKCIGNLIAIAQGESSEGFQNIVSTVTRTSKYQEILDSINLSGNNINGEVPAEILNLSYLRILNLSGNSIVGSIPEKFSKLGHLETLDLSSNRFSGAIPQSLGAISSLHMLNLSYNKLEGRIPKQLKFKDPSIYIGNELLCGKPLPKKCPKKQQNAVAN